MKLASSNNQKSVVSNQTNVSNGLQDDDEWRVSKMLRLTIISSMFIVDTFFR